MPFNEPRNSYGKTIAARAMYTFKNKNEPISFTTMENGKIKFRSQMAVMKSILVQECNYLDTIAHPESEDECSVPRGTLMVLYRIMNGFPRHRDPHNKVLHHIAYLFALIRLGHNKQKLGELPAFNHALETYFACSLSPTDANMKPSPSLPWRYLVLQLMNHHIQHVHKCETIVFSLSVGVDAAECLPIRKAHDEVITRGREKHIEEARPEQRAGYMRIISSYNEMNRRTPNTPEATRTDGSKTRTPRTPEEIREREMRGAPSSEESH